MNINIKEFTEQFRKKYEFLYESRNPVPGYREALDTGDKFIAEHPDFVAEFCKYRGDLLTSDREVAAFGFTLSDFLDMAVEKETGPEL